MLYRMSNNFAGLVIEEVAAIVVGSKRKVQTSPEGIVTMNVSTAFCVALLSLVLVPIRLARAQYTFTPIDYPDAISTGAGGINASGQIVGAYGDTGGNVHGFFLDSDGISFTSFDFPGVTDTEPNGINASRQVVGTYADAIGNHGFFWIATA